MDIGNPVMDIGNPVMDIRNPVMDIGNPVMNIGNPDIEFFYFSIKTMQHLSCQLFLLSFSLAKKHLSCRFFGFLLNSCQYFGSFCNNKNCFMYRFLLLLLKVYLFLFYSLKETQSSKFVIIASNCFFFPFFVEKQY